jgi:hypothetical protein
MFAVIQGEYWRTFKKFEKRIDAEEHLDMDMGFYNLIYTKPPEIMGVLTNKEFWAMYPEYMNYTQSRDIGEPLRAYLKERGYED